MGSESMQDDPHSSTTAPSSKQQTLTSSTISSPRFAYAHLGLVTEGLLAGGDEEGLESLQVRAYCSAALRRFLGDTGAGIPVDVLRVQSHDAWVRVPREDLAAFAAALTAFPGTKGGDGNDMILLRLQACGDWLGSLIGRAHERSF